MDLLTYSVFAIPLWVAQFALYFYLRSARRNAREPPSPSAPAASWPWAAPGSPCASPGRTPSPRVIFWFFLLCTAADALLEISFVPGMLVFGAAHVCLIFWLWGLSSPTWWSLALWVGRVHSHRRPLPQRAAHPGQAHRALFAVPVPCWGAAWPWPRPCLLPPVPAGGPWPWAACYSISPTCWWRKNQLSRWPDKWQKPIMALYWAALYLISIGTWPR